MLTTIKNKYHLKNPAYIGDTKSDELASKKAKMKHYHVTYGFGEKSKESGFNSFKGLLTYFLSSEIRE